MSVNFLNYQLSSSIMAMKAETALLPSEPETHTNSKHWRECLLCHNYSLAQEELHQFYSLKEEANLLFENNERWDLIKILYTEYFEQPAQVSGKEWMRLGFQGQYPETDFRGGGVLSLSLILRFVQRNKELVKQMQQDKAGFFFAITAINIAFFMKKYLHLADFLQAGKDIDIYCDRRALKNFCRMLLDNSDTYKQLHEMFLRYFYQKKWVPAQSRNSQTLLQFNRLFEELTDLIKQIFEGNDLNTIGDFRSIWEQKTE